SSPPPLTLHDKPPKLKRLGGAKQYQEIWINMINLGYNVSSGVLLAADFGTPQLRKRLFFIGCRKDIGIIDLPLPTHSPKFELFGLLPYLTVQEAFANLPDAEFSGCK
ncbi:MAG: DNA cytosine methyltransferase, partial [Dolichospermum sp.]